MLARGMKVGMKFVDGLSGMHLQKESMLFERRLLAASLNIRSYGLAHKVLGPSGIILMHCVIDYAGHSYGNPSHLLPCDLVTCKHEQATA